eukprot:scaffold288214_cov32-Tisochrysis_lutea.AAC.1
MPFCVTSRHPASEASIMLTRGKPADGAEHPPIDRHHERAELRGSLLSITSSLGAHAYDSREKVRV